MKNILSSIFRVTLFAIIILFPIFSGATTYVFTSFTPASWENENKWSPSYPGTAISAGDEVILNGICSITSDVTIEGTLTINAILNITDNDSLKIEAGAVMTQNSSVTIDGVLLNRGEITISNGKLLKVNYQGYFRHESGSTTVIEGELNNDFTVSGGGAFTITDGGSITNTSYLSISNLTIDEGGEFVHDGHNGYLGTSTNNGTFKINGGSVLYLGGTFNHNGTSATINGELNIQGNFIVGDGSTLTVGNNGEYRGFNHGDTQVYGSFLNNGTMKIEDDHELIIEDGGVVNQNGSLLKLEGNGEIKNGGTLNHNNGALTISTLFKIWSGGIFDHSGSSVTVLGTGTIENNGTVVLSSSETIVQGTLENNSVLILDSGATLRLTTLFTFTGTFVNNGNAQIFGHLDNDTGTVTISTGNTLTIESNGEFTHSGSQVDVFGTLENDGDMTVANGSTVTIKSTGDFYQNETLAINGELIVEGWGDYFDYGTNTNVFGTITVNTNGDFVHYGDNINIYGTLTNNGHLTVYSGSILNIDKFQVLTGSFIHDGQIVRIYGTLINSGISTINAGKSLYIQSTGTLTCSGVSFNVFGTLAKNPDGMLNVNSGKTLSIEAGGTLSIYGNGVTITGALDNEGIVRVSSFATITVDGNFTNNGILKGCGSISGAAGFTNPIGGSLAPGFSPGCFSFDTDFTNSGNIEIELQDGNVCSSFDRINVTGNASVNGAIDIIFTNGVPSSSTFTILTATGTISANPIINWPAGYTGSSSICTSCSPQEFQISFSLLPVELISFHAEKKENNSVELNWQTASENNNRGFEVQRSTDGMEWENIGFVNGAGTTTEKQYYSFIDLPNFSGLFYYRLRQIDFDGQFEFSQTRSVELENIHSELRIYPNPTSDYIYINMENNWEGEFLLRIFNTIGQEIYFEKIQAPVSRKKINLENMESGIYQAIISDGNRVARQAFIKQ